MKYGRMGVELGQLAYLAVIVLILNVIRRVPISQAEWSWRLVPYGIGTVAMYWVIERTSGFVS